MHVLIIVSKYKQNPIDTEWGIKSANVHYLAKMIYSEIKIKKIKY